MKKIMTIVAIAALLNFCMANETAFCEGIDSRTRTLSVIGRVGKIESVTFGEDLLVNYQGLFPIIITTVEILDSSNGIIGKVKILSKGGDALGINATANPYLVQIVAAKNSKRTVTVFYRFVGRGDGAYKLVKGLITH